MSLLPENKAVIKRRATLIFEEKESGKTLTLRPDSPRTKQAIAELGLESDFYVLK
jgi:hypothetical protein